MAQGPESVKGNHQANGPEQGHHPSPAPLVFCTLLHGPVDRKRDKQEQALQGPKP